MKKLSSLTWSRASLLWGRIEMIKYFIVAFVTAFAVALPGASFAGPLIWNSGFEASPANDDLFSQGPLRIRDLKENIRERLSVEHHFGSATTNDNGLHQVGSARCFVQDAEPTNLELLL